MCKMPESIFTSSLEFPPVSAADVARVTRFPRIVKRHIPWRVVAAVAAFFAVTLFSVVPFWIV